MDGWKEARMDENVLGWTKVVQLGGKLSSKLSTFLRHLHYRRAFFFALLFCNASTHKSTPSCLRCMLASICIALHCCNVWKVRSAAGAGAQHRWRRYPPLQCTTTSLLSSIFTLQFQLLHSRGLLFQGFFWWVCDDFHFCFLFLDLCFLAFFCCDVCGEMTGMSCSLVLSGDVYHYEFISGSSVSFRSSSRWE